MLVERWVLSPRELELVKGEFEKTTANGVGKVTDICFECLYEMARAYQQHLEATNERVAYRDDRSNRG